VSRHRGRVFAGSVAIVAAVSVLAACGGSSTRSGSGPTTTVAANAPKLKVLGPGVTADTVKVGIVQIDYSCIKQFVDSIRETEQKTDNLFIDYVNSHGGVAGGKKIVPVYKKYCPRRPRGC